MHTVRQSDPPVVGKHNGFEVYPMPMFATMETADVNALVQWYRAALDFRIVFKMPNTNGQPSLVHLRRRKYQDVLVVPAERRSDMPGFGAASLCLQADENVDRLAARAAAVPAVGRVRVERVVDTPWNTRQVRIMDPEGRRLVFTQPRLEPESTEKVMRIFRNQRRFRRFRNRLRRWLLHRAVIESTRSYVAGSSPEAADPGRRHGSGIRWAHDNGRAPRRAIPAAPRTDSSE